MRNTGFSRAPRRYDVILQGQDVGVGHVSYVHVVAGLLAGAVDLRCPVLGQVAEKVGTTPASPRGSCLGP
jgi:hypothetical protein